MTMQIPDTVIYDVAYETGAYCADLLKPYLEKHHIELLRTVRHCGEDILLHGR